LKENIPEQNIKFAYLLALQSLAATITHITSIRTAAAAHITTAGVRATLAPADPNQQQEENTTKDDNSHKHPLYKGDKKDSSGNLVSVEQADPEGRAALK